MAGSCCFRYAGKLSQNQILEKMAQTQEALEGTGPGLEADYLRARLARLQEALEAFL